MNFLLPTRKSPELTMEATSTLQSFLLTRKARVFQGTCMKLTGSLPSVRTHRTLHKSLPIKTTTPPETAPQPVTSSRAIHAVPQLHTSKVIDTIDPPTTVQVHQTSFNGEGDIQTLPTSGADISAAGRDALRHLGEHEDNLLPSHIISCAVNGTSMKLTGRLTVTFWLDRTGLSGYHCIVDVVVIYDSNIAHHTNHVRLFLRCAECKITLNNEKWQFA